MANEASVSVSCSNVLLECIFRHSICQHSSNGSTEFATQTSTRRVFGRERRLYKEETPCDQKRGVRRIGCNWWWANQFNHAVEDSADYRKALSTLEKQKENHLLLINTELRMRLESANTLAAFEEKRIDQFFNVFSVSHREA